MKVITVRNVPEDVHRALTRLAERHRRSLQQQALLLLERARQLDRESPLGAACELRERLAGRNLGDTVEELREDRDR
jgi:plasmid stability protein